MKFEEYSDSDGQDRRKTAIEVKGEDSVLYSDEH